ncbi:MAG: OmpA family protein, partial [Betaproteobacteria bacterium]
AKKHQQLQTDHARALADLDAAIASGTATENKLAIAQAELSVERSARADAAKELDRFHEENRRLSTELAKESAARASGATRLQQIQAENDQQRKNLEDAAAAQTVGENKLKQTQSELSAERVARAKEAEQLIQLQAEKKNLFANVGSETAARATLAGKLEGMQAERDRLAQAVETERSARMDAEKKIESVQNELALRQSALAESSKALQAAQVERDGLASELQSAKNALSESENQLADAKIDLVARRNAAADVDVKLAAALAERDQAQVSLNKALAELKTARDSLAGKESSFAEVSRNLEATASERQRLSAEVQSLQEQVSKLGAKAAALDAATKQVELEKQAKIDELKHTYDNLLNEMKTEVAKGEITISQLRDKLTVNVLDEILFDSGSTQIKPRGLAVLKRVGAILNKVKDKTIVIEGHTDNVQISRELAKKYPTNWELSTARATSVVRYLQDESKLDPERLSAAGYGLYHPVDTNDTPEGKQRNRRIEIKLIPTATAATR